MTHLNQPANVSGSGSNGSVDCALLELGGFSLEMYGAHGEGVDQILNRQGNAVAIGVGNFDQFWEPNKHNNYNPKRVVVLPTTRVFDLSEV